MLKLLTWVRECDEADFGRFFARAPDITVHNARREKSVPISVSGEGLLLSGGPDISADFLAQPVGDASLIQDPNPERDSWEFALVRAFLEAGKPILAICKGMQLLNVALGGTLHLDIRGHDLPEARKANIQPLRYQLGTTHVFERVNSSHHQALAQLGDGLEVEAWCEADDVIEQVRLKRHRFALGVQYHPERDDCYATLFEDFFNQLRGGKS